MLYKILLNPQLLLMIAVGAMVVLCLAAYLMRAVARTRHLPICWNCGAAKVRRSLPQHFLDSLTIAMFLNPYRCKGCRVRFYGLRSRRHFAEHATDGSVWWGT